MPRQRAILIAGPLLNEGVRAHFALREVALRTARAGFDVLRFDFAGLGNSCGATKNSSLRRWSSDIVDAAEELRELSGSSSLTVIAVRFSANLALPLVANGRIEQLLTWDPVLLGAHWRECLSEWRANAPAGVLRGATAAGTEFMGYALGDGFLDELEGRECPSVVFGKLAAVVTEQYRNLSTLEALTNEIDEVASNCRWQDHTSDVLYPADVMEALCRRLI